MLKTFKERREKQTGTERERKRKEDKRVQNVEIFQKNSSSNNGGEQLSIMMTFTGDRATHREKALRSKVNLKEST